MSTLVHLEAIVHGRVQGVYFRTFVAHNAAFLGLVGYARNMPDGITVKVEAQGNRDSLRKLVSLLEKGPPGAEVREVVVRWREPDRIFEGFEVK